jgi:glyoxylase-like metal-dependent hydrolase (beta-lactamase superfamily II)
MSHGTSAAKETGDTPFNLSFESRPGELVRLSPLVRRMIAPNPGPMTFTGTCTYVVGLGEVAVLDPGPDSSAHITALLHALRGETLTTILVTHTHKDHSAGAQALKATTGARIIGCAPYQSRALATGTLADTAHDRDHAPDAILREGDAIETRDFSLVCVETPGHTRNHQSFALPQEKALFSGDHVMAWSTSVIAPPDGVMCDYMASLEKLLGRDDKIYWPGHGGPVKEPQSFLRALIHHRRVREEAILARIKAGDRSLAAIVANVYQGLDPALEAAAALSVLAHIVDVVARGVVDVEGKELLGRLHDPASSTKAALEA